MTARCNRSTLRLLPLASVLVVSTPVAAGSLAVIGEGQVVETVLSDGMPIGAGRWQQKVQQVFDPMSQTIERRRYEYFDPEPERRLNVSWHPDDMRADRPGRISGAGSLVWRSPDRPAWDPTGIVRIFTGTMINGRPHGPGKLITNGGLLYEGMWRNGRADGAGRLKLPTGAEYLGSFRSGMADGKGRQFDITGETFEGTFRAGLRSGKGQTKLPSGFQYDSDWIGGVETGWSQRIRLAQTGGPRALGGGEDIRLGITVAARPQLRSGARLEDIVPYKSSNDGNHIGVGPADAKLMAAWKGNGEVQTTIGTSEVRSGIFDVDPDFINGFPPALVVELQNRSAQAIRIASLRLNVEQSDTDNQPAIQLVDLSDPICGSSYSTEYDLENFGWSPARRAQMRISFDSYPQLSGAITKPIGDLPAKLHINLDRELAGVGVNVARLKQTSDRGFPCPSGSMQACLQSLRSNAVFGSLGPKLRLQNSQLIVDAHGLLEYQWQDNKGANHNRSSPFKIIVGLGKIVQTAECGEGAKPEAPRVDTVHLRLDAANYTLPVPFQKNVAAGQMARMSLPVDAAKSSNHSFRVIAILADGREIASLPIQLLYFRPSKPH